MTRMRRLAFLSISAALAACGINVVGLDLEPTPAPGDGGPTVTLPDGARIPAESGVVPNDAGDGTVTPEGGPPLTHVDAGDSGAPFTKCEDVISTDFATLDARWKLTGAKYQNGRVELTTEGESGHAGGLWWSEPIVFGSTLTATFHYQQVQSNAQQQFGVGIGIGWVANNSTWKVGDAFSNVGICNSGLSGVAATLRFQGNSGRLDSVSSIATNCGTNGGYSDTAIPFGSGTLVLKLTPGRVEATTIAHTDPVDMVVSTTGYVGFTAATGSTGNLPGAGVGTSLLAISEVKVQRCP